MKVRINILEEQDYYPLSLDAEHHDVTRHKLDIHKEAFLSLSSTSYTRNGQFFYILYIEHNFLFQLLANQNKHTHSWTILGHGYLFGILCLLILATFGLFVNFFEGNSNFELFDFACIAVIAEDFSSFKEACYSFELFFLILDIFWRQDFQEWIGLSVRRSCDFEIAFEILELYFWSKSLWTHVTKFEMLPQTVLTTATRTATTTRSFNSLLFIFNSA